jgi:endonuclease/exonuclease/phosphatase (EEP) superfamily protein YafD
MKIATLNTRGFILPTKEVAERFVAMSREFNQLSCDVLHLQEVWSYGQLSVLKRELPSYFFAYHCGVLGPKAGLVTLSRFPLQRAEYIDFPPVGEPKKRKAINRWKRRLKNKGALIARTEEVTTINTHLVANGDGDWSTTSRYSEAHRHDLTMLASTVLDLAKWGESVLVAGDFNFPKESSFYKQFVSLAPVYDVFGQDTTPTFHQEFLSPGQQAHCIDYIFHSERFRVMSSSRIFKEKIPLPSGFTYASDHDGLVASFETMLLRSKSLLRSIGPLLARKLCIRGG